MSTFIGALLDVSRSMKSSIGDGVDEEGGTWARSIFTVIDDLVKHDVSNANRIFVVGFGASKGKDVFDILGTIEEVQRHQSKRGPAEYQTIEEVFRILESNGARTIRKWAAIDTIRQAVSENEAQLILNTITLDIQFRRKFVNDCLPLACRDWENVFGHGLFSFVIGLFFQNEMEVLAYLQDVCVSITTTFKQATTEDVKEVVRKAITLIIPPVTHRTIEKVFRILESNGARTIRKWAKIDTIRQAVSENEAQLILNTITLDIQFRRKFVNDCLPPGCGDWENVFGHGLFSFVIGLFFQNEMEVLANLQDVCVSIATTNNQATTEDVKEVVRKAITLIMTGPVTHRTIEEVFRILESNGARTIRKWAKIDTIRQAVSENMAQIIRKKLISDHQFTRRFVYDYLPGACRDWEEQYSYREEVFSSVASLFYQAEKEDIEEVVGKVLLKDVSERCVFNVQDAANIIRGCIDERELTTQRARELLKIVEPFIYGGAPLYAALGEASDLQTWSVTTHPNHHRLLFILSDGCPGDDGSKLTTIQSQLKDAKVTVVSCYICRLSRVEPRRLYSVVDEGWEEGARLLFDLSSKIPTEFVTRAVFIKHGWQIDITNNETKLFLHVNHPDHLKDACSLARNAVCFQDSLSDLLVSVDLDIYINQKNSGIKAHKQMGGTCYANASAAVLHLAMHRILGRDGGYPDFDELRNDMINRYGIKGAKTLRVLQEVCPRYRLQCEQVDVNGAKEAIAAKRPVVARFRLTDEEWNTFERFYLNNPTGILKKHDLDISKRRQNARPSGHAVVLTSFNSECLRLMNSWGDSWADIGFFRVENAEVLGLEFYDVYWTLDDLSQREKDYYDVHGSQVAEKLMKSLKGLQVSVFTCPSCRQTSKVTEYTGTLSRARCPKCMDEFSSQDADGNILALNVYLTSLSR